MHLQTHPRLHLRLALPTLVVLAACAAAPELSAPPARVLRPTVEPELAQVPTPAAERPSGRRAAILEESDAGDNTEFQHRPDALPTPALAALDTAPTPAAAEVAAVPSSQPETAAPNALSEAVLPQIGPKTPPNVAAALRLIDDGRQQLAQGRYDQALERFERSVAIDPTNAYGYYYLAQLYSLTKKYDQASAFAARAVTLAARSDRTLQARAYGLQAAVFEEVGRYADARRAYEKAIQADPNNLAARTGMTRLGGGQ